MVPDGRARRGVGYPVAAVVVTLVVCGTAIGIFGMQVTLMPNKTQTLVETSTLTNVITSTATITATQVSVSTVTSTATETQTSVSKVTTTSPQQQGGTGTAQVAVTGQNLVAIDFLSTNSAADPTCNVTGAVDDLTLTNTGTAAASVTGVTITWAGEVNSFPISGTCIVAAAGNSGATTNGNPISILFTATNKLDTSAVPGQTYVGTVSMGNGAVMLFQGTFN